MPCSHANPPGYAVCAVCGQELAIRRCACGFVCRKQDDYCGRCGTALDAGASSQRSTPRLRQSGHYDLTLLQEVANKGLLRLGRAKTKVDQDDIRQMLAAMKKGTPCN
jgi:hypothetical protein